MPGVARGALAASRLLRANFARLKTPLKVTLCVTYRCQYRCRTCNIWRRRPTGELTTDELLKFVAVNRDVGWLDVTGGEVFLRNDIPELFDAVAGTWKKLALLHFATNGFLTDRIVGTTRRLASRTLARVIVTVSVDGDELLNDEIRGVRGGYRRQIETFNELRRLPGVRTVFGMTLSKHNLGRVQETFLACQRAVGNLSIEDFHVNVAQRSDHYYGNTETDDLQAANEDLRSEVSRYRRMRGYPTTLSGWVESRYLHHLDLFLRNGSSPMRCHALRSSLFVDPWGTVFPCITYTRPLGSLRDTDMSLEPIWNGRASCGVQREIWGGRCPQCWTACEAYQSILGNLLRVDSPPMGGWRCLWPA